MTAARPSPPTRGLSQDVAAVRCRAMANARVRDHRRRKRDRLRLVPLEIFEHELDALVTHGLLSPDKRTDYRVAVPEALEKLIEKAISCADRRGLTFLVQ